jgi:hypothetical protein
VFVVRAIRVQAAPLLALLLAIHHPCDLSAQSAPCVQPKIDTAGWQIITLADCGIRLKLPTNYRETDHQVTSFYRIHIYRSGFETVEIKWVRNITLTERKVIRQDDYEDYIECNGTIGRRAALIQSFRGGGTFIGPKGENKTYHVEAFLELQPGAVVQMRADTLDRSSQEKMLAAVWTAQFDNLDRDEPNKATVRMKLFFWSILPWLVLAAPLVVYVTVVCLGAFVVFGRKRRQWKAIRPARYRAYLSGYLALVLTPSVVSDFWLFMIPAPALVGLLFFLPALFSGQLLAAIYIIALYYIIPILLAFGIFYLALMAYSRFRSRRAPLRNGQRE